MDGTFTKEEADEDVNSGSDESEEEDEEEIPPSRLEYTEESDDAAESGSLPAESASLGSDKKGKTEKKAAIAKPSLSSTSGTTAKRRPPFLEIIVDAITAKDDKKGASAQAIKTYIREKYPDISENVLKKNFKSAILRGIENDTLFRPKGSQDNKGAVGRFKISPEYLKAKVKSEKLKEKQRKQSEKAKTDKAKTARKKKAPAKTVNGKELKSLKEKSLAVQVAKERIKKARKSMGLTPNAKPKVAPKKKARPLSKKAATSKSPKVAKSAKPKPKASKTTKGTTKEPANKKLASAATKKKTTKAK
uniref:histone 24-like n=1 Tax=Styela clava TaxID=7725 RepID=UPI001939F893|nr:histone 24-like [Styela clava]